MIRSTKFKSWIHVTTSFITHQTTYTTTSQTLSPHATSLLGAKPPPPTSFFGAKLLPDGPSSASNVICPPIESSEPATQVFNFPQNVGDFLPLAMKIVRSLRPSSKSKIAGSGRTSKAKSSSPASEKRRRIPWEVKPWCLMVCCMFGRAGLLWLCSWPCSWLWPWLCECELASNGRKSTIIKTPVSALSLSARRLTASGGSSK
jgi:hypothetical protein